MDFVEGKIVEEKEFEGVVFLRTLNPPPRSGEEGEQYGARDLIEMIKEKREELWELLRRHSAVLLRGFDVRTADEFGLVVEALGWEEMPYTGAVTRIKMADRVYTANEGPVDQLVNFHHEMALIKEFASKIIFFCSQPSLEGGQTSILPSNILADKMIERFPEFTAKLSSSACVFRGRTPKQNNQSSVVSLSWKSMLETDDQVEAEKRAKEMLGSTAVDFKEDGSAEFIYGPMNPIRVFEGKKAWFNTILGYTKDGKELTVSFGDGSPVPAEVFEGYKEILDEICVDINWQKGDILLADNLHVQHARRPGKPPRVILVSLCK